MNHYLNKAPGSKLKNSGQDILYFGGTAYLGLQTDPDFQDLLIKNIRQLGTNWGASRKSNIRLAVFEEFETYLSRRSGSESCLCVSSGYMAGQMLKRHFSEQGFTMFCAPNTHPALIHENSRLFKNYDELGVSLEEHFNSSNSKNLVLFLDTIDFSGLNFPDFTSLKKLTLENVIVVADDSHGFGLIGKDGYGSYELLSELRSKELIVCGSLGKALATPSGVILGSEKRMKKLSDMEFFAGGSPPSPAALKCLMEAEEIVKNRKARLEKNREVFVKNISSEFQMTAIDHHPVFGYHNEALTAHLLEKNILTTNFRYPAVTSPLVSKIVLNADHTEQDILQLTEAINSFLEAT